MFAESIIQETKHICFQYSGILSYFKYWKKKMYLCGCNTLAAADISQQFHSVSWISLTLNPLPLFCLLPPSQKSFYPLFVHQLLQTHVPTKRAEYGSHVKSSLNKVAYSAGAGKC